MFDVFRGEFSVDVQKDPKAPGHGVGNGDFLSAEQGNKVHPECPGGFGGERGHQILCGGEHGRDHLIEVSDLVSSENFFHQFPGG